LLCSIQARFESCPMSRSLICKSKMLFEWVDCDRHCGHITNDRNVASAVRARRVWQLNGQGYFFMTSAFSIMATPPRSASLPFNVIVFPQYSAN